VPPAVLRTGDLFEADCSGLDDDGGGLVELVVDQEALHVHVAGVLPGEHVRACLDHVSVHRRSKRREAWASLREILAPSAERVAVSCPAYGACGGCTLMALAYPAQLAWKTEKVRAELAQHRALAGLPVEACAPSAQVLGYRNQAKYVYGRERASGRLVLGGFAPRSHDVVDLAGCQVVEPILDETRGVLLSTLVERSVEPFDEIRRTGMLRYAILRATAAGQVMATLVVARKGFPDAGAIATALRDRLPAVASVVLNVNSSVGNALFGDEETSVAGSSTVEDTVGDVHVRLSSRSFFQANRVVASTIYRAIAESIPDGIACAVDAYAGAGGIALSLVPKTSEVIAIEESAAATAAAADLLAERSKGRIRTVTGDAGACLEQIAAADAVVVNPPRKGCDERVLAALARLRPQTLLYLSCNPRTLSRDLARLVGAGASVVRISPFDMMPHTPHVETLALARFG
jgi:23S rRNA (uracil1939-C5)-methyltransferase